MRISLTRGNAPYGLPPSAVIAGAALLSLGLLTAGISRNATGPVTCPLRAVTGLPCPTCGMVRVTGQVMRGEIGDALRTNPFDTMTLLLGVPMAALLLAANRFGGWAVRFTMTRREKLTVWAVAAALALANWAYVLSVWR